MAVVALGVASAGPGCHTQEPPLSTASRDQGASELKPRPPGIAVDPVFVLPSARAESTTEHGLVVLNTPGDLGKVRALVRGFFRAVTREDSSELAADFADGATVVVDKSGKRVPAVAWWQQRFARLDYRAAENAVLFEEHRIETYRPEDMARSPRVRLAVTPATADLVVRLPVTTPRVGRVRLWGDEIWLVLVLRANGYRIAQMQEYFDLP
jgi:ketosteroid isomerase-like protein